MKKCKFEININCPSSKAYDTMLGISDISSYNEWTKVFNPTSTYEGNWEKGSKMLLIGIDENGEKSGMISRILENDTDRFISIQHYGMLKAGQEITEGPEVDPWAGGLENYSFKEEGGVTTVTIEIDVMDGHEAYMDKIYPKALETLKEICERKNL